MNLLAETLKVLADNGKAPADVRRVQTHKAAGSWDDFARFADFEYDDGYGGHVVNLGLLIVGDAWWLERGEYDGSEWWEFKALPKPVAEPTVLRASDLL